MRTLFTFLGAVFVTMQSSAQISNITTVTWEKVPAVVQQSIQVNGGGGPASTVQRGLENGQPVYSVVVPSGEGEKRVVVRENGTLGPVQPDPTAQPLVAPVSQSVNPALTNTLPQGVTQQTVGGQTVFNVVSEGSTQTSQIQITPDARVVSTTQVGPQGSVEMQKVPRSSVPPAVERAIQTQTGPGQVVDIVHGTFNGRSVYDIVYEQSDDRIKLRVADNGSVLAQSIISTPDNRTIDVEPWIGYHQVPVVVQTSLAAIAGDNPIETVRQEVVDGRITYLAVYRENGRPVSVRISQTGQLLQ